MTRKQTKANRKRYALIAAIFAVILLLIVGGVIYVNDYYRADEAAVEAMAAADDITVEKTSEDILVFIPPDPKAGLIFYPGGKVEYTAYAPLMRAYAEKGILCVLVKMPCNLAVQPAKDLSSIKIQKGLNKGNSEKGAISQAYRK